MSNITRVGVDLAKHLIQVHAVDAAGRVVTNRALKRDKFLTWCSQLPGVSEFLCKRDGLQLTQIRSPNSMVNRFSAAFQSRIGILHFWLMLRKAR